MVVSEPGTIGLLTSGLDGHIIPSITFEIVLKMKYICLFLSLLSMTSTIIQAQVNQVEQKYMQNWLALSSTSDLDLASLPMPVEGQEMADVGSATSQWQRLASNYPTIHLNPFYQTDVGSVLYLLGQLESRTQQVIYVTLAGLSSQDQVWINNRRLAAVQGSNPSHTYPFAVQLKAGLNTVGLKISSLSPLIKWQMWPSRDR